MNELSLTNAQWDHLVTSKSNQILFNQCKAIKFNIDVIQKYF